MYQKINEKIKVAGVYKDHTFQPFKFQWNNRQLKIDKITLVSNLRNGLTKKRLYSVLIGNDIFRLLFDRDSEVWTIEEVWVD